MGRIAQHNPAELEQQLGTRGQVTVDSTNRHLVQKWLTANGVEARVAKALTVGMLAKLYNDATNVSLYKVRDEWQKAEVREQFGQAKGEERHDKFEGEYDGPEDSDYDHKGKGGPGDDKGQQQQGEGQGQGDGDQKGDGNGQQEKDSDKNMDGDKKQGDQKGKKQERKPIELPDEKTLEKLAQLAKVVDPNMDLKDLLEQMQQRANEPPPIPEMGGGDQQEASWHARLARQCEAGWVSAIVGPAGNGKTYGARAVLEALGYNVYEVDITDATTSEHLLARLDLEPDGKGGVATVVRHGPIARAAADPKGAVLMNEFDAGDPRSLMALQAGFESRTPRTFLCPDVDGGKIVAAGSLPIVLTLNTVGSGATREYVGRNTMDIATMNRIAVIYTTYENEDKILESGGIDRANARALALFAAKVREEVDRMTMRVVLSLRDLQRIGYAMQAWRQPAAVAIREQFLERLDADDREALEHTVKPLIANFPKG